MYGFKTLSIFLAVVGSVVAIPVAPGVPTDLQGTTLPGSGLNGVTGVNGIVGNVVATAGGATDGTLAGRDILGLALGDVDLNGVKVPPSTDAVTGAAALPQRRQAGTPAAPATPPVDAAAAPPATPPVDTTTAPSPPSTQVAPPATLPEVFQTAILRLEPIIARLKASVSVTANINIDVVVAILGEVIIVLNDVVVQLQAIVDAPVPFVLSLAGTVLAIPQVVFIISSLVWLVITALHVVVSAVVLVGGTAHGVVDPLVAQIGALLANVITLAGHIVVGLVPLLAAALTPIAHFLWYLNIGQVAAVLGIAAPITV